MVFYIYYIHYIYTSCNSVPWELKYTRSWMEKNGNPVIIFQVYQRIEIYIIDQPTANSCTRSWTEKNCNPDLVVKYYIPSFQPLFPELDGEEL